MRADFRKGNWKVDGVAAWILGISRKEIGQGGSEGQSTLSTLSTKSKDYRESSANAALVLLSVACGLLDRQLAAQAAAFTDEGGFTERLYRIRSERRRTK